MTTKRDSYNSPQAKDAGELFELSVRGMLAGMFVRSGTDPSTDQWEILRGTKEITIRELAEIAFELGFELSFDYTNR